MKKHRILAMLCAVWMLLCTGCSAGTEQKTELPVIGTTASATTAAATVPVATTAPATTMQTSEAPATTSAPPETTTELPASTTQTTTAEADVRYEDVEARFSAMTTEEKVGQLFIVSVSGTTLSDEDRALLDECAIGNIVLFASNIEDTEQLAELNTELMDAVSARTGICPFIAVDQEGGRVLRLFDACTAPPAMAVGATGDTQTAQRLYELMGAQLRTLGINVNFAPVADVNSNPDNPVIGDRSFSEDPETAAEFVSAAVLGLQSSGVLSCLKHFPGHGDTAEDSHTTLPGVSYNRDRLDSVEFVPFSAGIAAGAEMTMVGHILYPALGAETTPASLTPEVIEGVLRTELGFDGLVVTDSLSMGAITKNWGEEEACVMAINAGADLLCINDSSDALRACREAVLLAVQEGRISEARLDEAVLRILNAKYEYGVLAGARPSAQLPDTEEYAALLETIARESLAVTEGEAAEFGASSTLVLYTEPSRTSRTQETRSFGAYMSHESGCDSIEIDSTPSTAEIEEAVQSAEHYAHIVLAVRGDGCTQLAARLAATGAAVSVVVLDDVYTAESYTQLGAALVLTAWEYSDCSVRAAAEYITG